MRRQATCKIVALAVVASLSHWAVADLLAGCGCGASGVGCGCSAACSDCSACSGCGGYGCSGCAVGYPACGPVGCGACVPRPSLGCAVYSTCAGVGHHCSCCLAKLHSHCMAFYAWKYNFHASRYNRWAGGCAPYRCAAGGYVPSGCSSCGCAAGGCATGCGCGAGVASAYAGSPADGVISDQSVGEGTNPPGTIDLPPGAKIISDRIIDQGQAPTPAPAPDDQSALGNRSPFRLAGLERSNASGSAEFERGLEAFRGGSMNDALRAFASAAETEPSNAIYHYYRALAMFEVAGADGAQNLLATAVEVERREGVENWGKRMERVQGRGRLWVENARRSANLVR